MKKLLIILLLMFAKEGFGQLYINIGTANLSPRGDTKLQSETYDSNLLLKNAKMTNFSYAAGGSINVGVGYMFNKNFGIELAFSAIFGKKFTTIIDYVDTYGGVIKNNQQIGNYRAPLSVFATPSVVFRGKDLKGIIPYGKIGLAILSYGKQYYDFTLLSDISSNPVIYSETETSNRFTIGFAGALGINIPINKKLKLGFEGSVLSLNPYVKKSTMTKHMRNGTDNLSTFPTSKKETNYVKQFKTTPSYSQDVPDTQLSYTNNYSNVGVMVSVCYSLGK